MLVKVVAWPVGLCPLSPIPPAHPSNTPLLCHALRCLAPPPQVQAQKYNAGYLAAKHARMDHILVPEMNRSLDLDDVDDASLAGGAGGEEALEGQFCFWDHKGEPSSAGIPLEAPVGLPDGLDGVSSQIVCTGVGNGSASGGSSDGSSGDGNVSGSGSTAGPPAAPAS